MRPAGPCVPAGRPSSDRLYVLGPGTLGPLPLGVLHGLAFLEPAEAVAFHRRAMEEELTFLTRDETKTLVRNQLLDSAPHHPTPSVLRYLRFLPLLTRLWPDLRSCFFRALLLSEARRRADFL